jgi:LAO/AO transport system kinase
MQIDEILQKLPQNSHRHIARAITIVENELVGYESFLEKIQIKNTPVLGFTGPPGAGKSTLVNQLIKLLLSQNKKVAVVAVDPTSPFNYGAILGDRIRMLEHYKNDHLYIRSVATRGSLGGLSDKIIEIIEVLKASSFDYIIIETVGVGQSEVEIAGISDVCSVVLVPEAGDHIQSMKSGLMEIADIFIVNKADREGADTMINALQTMLHYRDSDIEIPIVKTEALNNIGIDELFNLIESSLSKNEHKNKEKKQMLLALKVYKMIQKDKMKHILLENIKKDIGLIYNNEFNIYKYINNYKSNI